jgi:flagellin-like protein
VLLLLRHKYITYQGICFLALLSQTVESIINSKDGASQIRINMRYTETTGDSAVSPVIGVILMVAVTVILAAVIGTFVLGIGGATDSSASAGVSVEQEAGQSLTVEIVDTGNLDEIIIAGPDGARSVPFSTEVLRSGARIEIREGGFAPEDVNPAIEAQGNPLNLINGKSLDDDEGPDYDTPGPKAKQQLDDDGVEESCRVVHGADVVKGISVKGGDLGCSGQNLKEYITDPDVESFGGEPSDLRDPAYAPDDFDGKREALEVGDQIEYKVGEYRLIGVVDGKEQVLQTITTTEE